MNVCVCVCERESRETEGGGDRRGSRLILVQRFTTAERLQREQRRRHASEARDELCRLLDASPLHSHQSRGAHVLQQSASSCVSAGHGQAPPQESRCTAVSARYSCSGAWPPHLQNRSLRKTRRAGQRARLTHGRRSTCGTWHRSSRHRPGELVRRWEEVVKIDGWREGGCGER